MDMDRITLTGQQQFLVKESLRRQKCFLCIKMGGGKTFMGLTMAVNRLNETNLPCLIIAPAQLVPTWFAELPRCFPDVKLTKLDASWKVKEPGLYIVTGTRLGMTRQIITVQWGCIVMDEVHKYSNYGTYSHSTLATLSSNVRIGMSGTLLVEPKESKVKGLFTAVIQENWPAADFNGLDRYTVRPFNPDRMLQRRYTVTQRVVEHAYTEGEIFAYNSIKKMFDTLRRQRMRVCNSYAITHTYIQLALACIGTFKEFLTCPVMPFARCVQIHNSAPTRFMLILYDIMQTAGIMDWLDREDSLLGSRLEAAVHELEKYRDCNVVVFTCNRPVLNVLEHELQQRQIPVFKPRPGKKNADVLKEFAQSTGNVLLLTYTMGAEGLNLQSANVVFLLDMWWNHGTVQQAIGRVARPGQERDVIAVHFSSTSRLEQEILGLHKNKHTRVQHWTTGQQEYDIESQRINVKEVAAVFNSSEFEVAREVAHTIAHCESPPRD